MLWGFLFLCVQGYEYVHNIFSINDGVFSACFYILTGFHGLHVFLGLLLIIIAFLREVYYHFSKEAHNQMLSAIWY
jgi:cytochrome c oxidase subunit 3